MKEPRMRLVTSLSLLVALALALSGCNRPAEHEAGHAPAEEQAHGHADEHAGEESHREGVVEFATEAQAQAKLAVQAAENRSVSDVFATTGEFEANGDRLAHVKPATSGRVTSVRRTVGDRVRAGETLATLESLELGEAQASFLEAEARVTLAQEGVERQRRLFSEDLTARKEVVAAENALRVARIDREQARHRLGALGMSVGRLEALSRTHRIEATLPLTAPLAGIVSERHLTLGETVEAGGQEPAFVILDTSDLWVHANLYEKDLARVHVGQAAEVTTPAYPGRTFRGKVTLVSPVLDPETRTAQARIAVANPDGRLKPEMFATVALHAGSIRAIAVPAQAVMQDKGATYVFVQTGETTFERRDVEVGPKAGGFVPVRSGLQAGDRVVTEGAFVLKAELLKESFGEHEH